MVIECNKLVRDRIPEIIQSGGDKPFYRVLNDDEYSVALHAKLVEEVDELIQAKTNIDRMEEIGDIWAVLGAIMELYEIDIDDTAYLASIKAHHNGVFEQRYFLDKIEEVWLDEQDE